MEKLFGKGKLRLRIGRQRGCQYSRENLFAALRPERLVPGEHRRRKFWRQQRVRLVAPEPMIQTVRLGVKIVEVITETRMQITKRLVLGELDHQRDQFR